MEKGEGQVLVDDRAAGYNTGMDQEKKQSPAPGPPQPQPAAGVQDEQTLWTGYPSQWTGTGVYALCALAGLMGLLVAVWQPSWGKWFLILTLGAVVVAGRKYLRIRSNQYTLTNQRLITRAGVVTRRTDELELYRVRDSFLLQPLWYRLLGLGIIVLNTSDKSSPTLRLPAIKNAHLVRELIRKHVERIRVEKGVREVEMD